MREPICLLGIVAIAGCGQVTKTPDDDADDDGASDTDGAGDDTDDDGTAPGYYRLSVDVTGLRGTLVLQNAGGDDLTITEDGPHRFATDVQDGSDFEVTVMSDPELQNCHVDGATGTISADVQLAVGCYGNIFMWIDDNPDGNEYNHELWMSDGTQAGTGRVVNINQDETVGSGPSTMTRYSGLYYLVSNDGGGPALWRTDGTQANTQELRTFDTVDLGSGGLVHDDALYFVANGDAAGTELWRYNGSQFQRLTNINPTGNTNFGQSFAVLGNRLVFPATDNISGDNPWSYDLGSGASQLLIDVIPGAFTGQVSEMITLGNRAVFRADHETAGLELWSTDGTPAGTDLLKDINPGGNGASINFLATDGAVAYLRASDASGAELWKTDGTTAGTVMVRNIAPGAADSNPGSMVAFAGKFWFVATDADGAELWSTDGTTEGTQKLEVNPSTSIGSNPYGLTVAAGRLYFVADGGDGAGTELWATDGTAEGTVRVTDVAPGQDPGVGTIGPHDGRVLYFFDASYDTTQLWSTDGTADGTRKVADICQAPACNPYAQFVRVTE